MYPLGLILHRYKAGLDLVLTRSQYGAISVFRTFVPTLLHTSIPAPRSMSYCREVRNEEMTAAHSEGCPDVLRCYLPDKPRSLQVINWDFEVMITKSVSGLQLARQQKETLSYCVWTRMSEPAPDDKLWRWSAWLLSHVVRQPCRRMYLCPWADLRHRPARFTVRKIE